MNDIHLQQLVLARTVLLQAVDLLDNHLTSDEQLTTSSKYLIGSTIGRHLRHAHEHFVLLTSCLSQSPPYTLSYDNAVPNTSIESSRAGAKEAFLEAVKQLDNVVPKANMNLPVTLKAITPNVHQFQSSFGRELWFTNLHCVHHFSMIRVLAGELNLTLPSEFGFAPTTFVYGPHAIDQTSDHVHQPHKSLIRDVVSGLLHAI